MSNAERQQLFVQRHPGYYRQYRRKREAQREAMLRLAAGLKVTQPEVSTPAVSTPAVSQVATPPLMLPAPLLTLTLDAALFGQPVAVEQRREALVREGA